MIILHMILLISLESKTFPEQRDQQRNQKRTENRERRTEKAGTLPERCERAFTQRAGVPGSEACRGALVNVLYCLRQHHSLLPKRLYLRFSARHAYFYDIHHILTVQRVDATLRRRIRASELRAFVCEIEE